MQLQATPQFRTNQLQGSRGQAATPASPAPAQSQTQESRDFFVPTPVVGLATAVAGGALGLWAGASQGILPGAAAVAVGAAGGCLVGALAGSLVAQANPWDHNSWKTFHGAKAGAIPGAILGGAAALIANTSPQTGLVLGVAGAASGALLGAYFNEAARS